MTEGSLLPFGFICFFIGLTPSEVSAFEICLESRAWLSAYISEMDAGHWDRVLELTAPLPDQDRPALLTALQETHAEGDFDAGKMATLTIEGECIAESPALRDAALTHDISLQNIIGFQLGDAFVALSIIGEPDWFNFVAANLEGL